MVNLRVHPDRIEVHLTAPEKSLTLRSSDVVIERSNIRSATLTDDPWVWVRGIRRRGVEVPLVLAAGTWKHHGGADFIVVKGKRQAVVLELSGGEFDRVMVTTAHAVELIRRLQLDAPAKKPAKPRRKPAAVDPSPEPTMPAA
ncbi:MAG TPA: hypothetical protein VFU07_10165 [Candidatus Lumbricidophila sp.]|nr:hypothetical protein [Candidatus Lumbricidophila sp.]